MSEKVFSSPTAPSVLRNPGSMDCSLLRILKSSADKINLPIKVSFLQLEDKLYILYSCLVIIAQGEIFSFILEEKTAYTHICHNTMSMLGKMLKETLLLVFTFCVEQLIF